MTFLKGIKIFRNIDLKFEKVSKMAHDLSEFPLFELTNSFKKVFLKF